MLKVVYIVKLIRNKKKREVIFIFLKGFKNNI